MWSRSYSHIRHETIDFWRFAASGMCSATTARVPLCDISVLRHLHMVLTMPSHESKYSADWKQVSDQLDLARDQAR